MIIDRVNGYLIRARNSGEIAEAVNLLLESDYIRKKIGNEARKNVEEKFTWEKIALKFEKLYEDMKKKEKVEAGPLDDLLKKIIGV